MKTFLQFIGLCGLSYGSVCYFLWIVQTHDVIPRYITGFCACTIPFLVMIVCGLWAGFFDKTIADPIIEQQDQRFKDDPEAVWRLYQDNY